MNEQTGQPEDRELDAVQRIKLYADFSKAGINISEAGPWIEEKSRVLGVKPRRLRLYIVREREKELIRIRKVQLTQSQELALGIGATVAAALDTLRSALTATITKKHFDRNGDEVDCMEIPNWEARNAAAAQIIKVFGGYAPDQLVLDSNPRGELSDLSDEQLRARLEKLRGKN